MRFSLVLATVGRTKELERFLHSLQAQTYRNFELIIVDQNVDGRIVPLIDQFGASFPITHLKTPYKGLSRARNLGLRYAKGDIVAFPDDDCVYSPELLWGVSRFFHNNPNEEMLIVKAKGLEGHDFPMQPRTAGRVSFWMMWHLSITWVLFVRRSVIQQVAFDEQIGVGAGTPWGSGEDTDFGLRALKMGFRIWYDPSLWVAHPEGPLPLEKARIYGRGSGYVLRKHGAWGKFAWAIARRGAGVLLYTLAGRREEAMWRWEALKGTIQGFFRMGARK